MKRPYAQPACLKKREQQRYNSELTRKNGWHEKACTHGESHAYNLQREVEAEEDRQSGKADSAHIVEHVQDGLLLGSEDDGSEIVVLALKTNYNSHPPKEREKKSGKNRKRSK
jgi:hypothetical protein